MQKPSSDAVHPKAKSPLPRSRRKSGSRKTRRHSTGKSKADGVRGRKAKSETAKSAKANRADKPEAVAEEARAAGQPTKYRDEFAGQASKLCQLGATDKDLAEFFKVSIATIWNWRVSHEEFLSALKVGKEEADRRVERSLFHRANGYSYEAVKIFQYEGAPVQVPYTEHVPPDTTACIFWLKNRRPDLWRDVSKTEHSGKVEVEHTNARESLARGIAGVAARLGAPEAARKPH